MFLLGYRNEKNHFLEYLDHSQLFFYSKKDTPIEGKKRASIMRLLGNKGNVAGMAFN